MNYHIVNKGTVGVLIHRDLLANTNTILGSHSLTAELVTSTNVTDRYYEFRLDNLLEPVRSQLEKHLDEPLSITGYNSVVEYQRPDFMESWLFVYTRND